jgi:hypothetical protein
LSFVAQKPKLRSPGVGSAAAGSGEGSAASPSPVEISACLRLREELLPPLDPLLDDADEPQSDSSEEYEDAGDVVRGMRVSCVSGCRNRPFTKEDSIAEPRGKDATDV